MPPLHRIGVLQGSRPFPGRGNTARPLAWACGERNEMFDSKRTFATVLAAAALLLSPLMQAQNYNGQQGYDHHQDYAGQQNYDRSRHQNFYNGAYNGGRGGSYDQGNDRRYDDGRYNDGHSQGHGIGTGRGALIGGAGGAALGAVFGGGLKGSLIGGAAGAGIGAVAGHEHQKTVRRHDYENGDYPR